jgi:hypothetical protein
MQCSNSFIWEWLEWETKFHNHDLYFEDRGRTFKSINIDKDYLPESERYWPIPYVVVPRRGNESLIMCPEELSPQVHSIVYTESSAKHYRFFIHPFGQEKVRQLIPNSWAYVDAERSEFMARPTSSLRSLVIWRKSGDGDPIMVKVSVFTVAHSQARFVDWDAAAFQLSRRRWLKLIEGKTLASVGMNLLDEIAFFGLRLDRPMIFDASTMGPGQKNCVHILANVFREFSPDILSGKTKLLSCTSYMSPVRKPASFIETIAAATGTPVLESLERTLISPAMHALEAIANNHGLTLEPHPQNLLIELDANTLPTGKLRFRDYGAVWLDPLRAFVRSPELLRSLMEFNHWMPMSPFESGYGRFNLFRSIGDNFMNSNAYRALAALLIRGLITNEDAEKYSEALQRRATDFLRSYFGYMPKLELFDAAQHPQAYIDVELAPRLSELDGILKLEKNEDEALRAINGPTGQREVKLKPVSWFASDHAPGSLSWYRHNNGYIGAAGEHVICLVMKAGLRS